MSSFPARKKLICAFFLFAFIPLPFFYLIGFNGLIPYMEKTEKHRLFSETINIAGSMQRRLQDFRSDTLILSESAALQEILDAEEKPSEIQRRRLESFFVSFALNRNIYYQIRYLDTDGQEIVRVNRGKPYPEKRLQNKRHRYYFTDTMKLSRSQVYVSPLDLNKEWNRIAIPIRPVIRYATPVFGSNGRKGGIVIINIDARYILNKTKNISSGNSTVPILVDSGGYYMSHPETARQWGGPDDFNSGYNLKKDYPENITMRLLSGKADVFLDDESGKIYAYAPVFPAGNEDNAWVFIEEASLDSGVFKTINYLKRLILAVIAGSIIAGAYLSYVLSGWLTANND